MVKIKKFYELSKTYGVDEVTMRKLILKNPKLAEHVTFRRKGRLIYRYVDEQGEKFLALYKKGANLNEICR